MLTKFHIPGIAGLGFAIPFVFKTINGIMWALKPNTFGGITDVIIYGPIAAIVLFFSCRSLMNARTKAELEKEWSK